MTLEQAQEWLIQNTVLFTTSQKFTPQQIDEFFAAYNTLTGENKPKTHCGRCVLSMKARLRMEHQKLIYNMKSYNVYKTEKGNYTFKPQGDVVLIIKAINQSAADGQLAALKTSQKLKE